MNLYKKCTIRPYSLLVIDTTLVSDNLLCFRKDLLERIQKLVIADYKIIDEKLQYGINRDAAKRSALFNWKN